MQCSDKTKGPDYFNFYFFDEKYYADDYFEEMCRFVSHPLTCPPHPYGLEFISQALKDSGRKNCLGREATGWTYYHRDRAGTEIEKIKIADKAVSRLLSLTCKDVLSYHSGKVWY
jgi:hypothetical protein